MIVVLIALEKHRQTDGQTDREEVITFVCKSQKEPACIVTAAADTPTTRGLVARSSTSSSSVRRLTWPRD